MPIDPLTAISIGSTIIGGLGSIFGSGTKTNIPPEVRKIYDMLLQRSQEGLSDEAVNLMLQRIKTNLGNEAGALGSLSQSRLARAGAGTGVQEAALSRINSQRLRGIGEGVSNVLLADEQEKARALQALTSLAPTFGDFTVPTGQGFADLFGSGLAFLLNRPDQNKNKKQKFSLEGLFDNPFDNPGTRIG